MTFPFPEHFTLREADAIERMRATMTDRELMEGLARQGGASHRPVKRSINEIGAYIERNPRPDARSVA